METAATTATTPLAAAWPGGVGRFASAAGMRCRATIDTPVNLARSPTASESLGEIWTVGGFTGLGGDGPTISCVRREDGDVIAEGATHSEAPAVVPHQVGLTVTHEDALTNTDRVEVRAFARPVNTPPAVPGANGDVPYEISLP